MKEGSYKEYGNHAEVENTGYGTEWEYIEHFS